MKKLYVAGLMLLLIFSITNITLGATEDSIIRFGAGLGMPYGELGGNVEISPSDHFALSAGLGVSPGGMNWSIGSRIYFTDKDQRKRPHLSAYYGPVCFTSLDDEDSFDTYKNIECSSVGFGIEWKLRDHLSLNGEILYITSFNYDDDYFPLLIAFGVHF